MSSGNREGIKKRIALRVMGVLATLALVWWLVREVRPSTWADALAQVPLGWWLLAAVAWLCSYGVRARRLQQEWFHRAEVPWSRCLALVLQHNAAVLLVPFRLGEAGYVWGVSRQWGVGVAEASWSLLRLRLQDLVILALLSIAILLPWGVGIAASLALLGWGWRQKVIQQASVPKWTASRELRRLLAGAGWPASALNWMLRLAVVGGCVMLLTPGGWDVASAAAVGAELGSLMPLQGPAALGPYEAGAWAAVAWKGSVPRGLVDAALMTHLFCVAIALGAAAFSLLLAPAGAQTLPHGSQESPHVTPASTQIR